MAYIREYLKLDKKLGKEVKRYRAEIRRKGFASKSAIFGTRTEAKNWVKDNEAATTLTKAGSGKTLKSLIGDFANLGHCAYASMYQLEFWAEQLGAKQVREITHGDINEAKLTLQTRKAMRSSPGTVRPTDRPLSPASINRYLAALSKVFSFAIDQGVIDVHPMKGGRVRKLKESGGRTRILNEDEEGRLYAAARASEWPLLYLFVLMAMTTGARKSEILRVKWQQIKLDQSIAVLGKTKNGRPRALPLITEVRELLEEAAKAKPSKGDYVFFDPRKPEQPKNIDSVWKKCRANAGLLNDRKDPLDCVVLHSTRHTAVTKLLRGGANLAQAAAVSGHQTLAMLKRYEHLAAADSVKLAENLLSGKKSS
jgi:integrase